MAPVPEGEIVFPLTLWMGQGVEDKDQILLSVVKMCGGSIVTEEMTLY